MQALPVGFGAGTTVQYTKSYTDYSTPNGWSAALLLTGACSLTVAGTPSGASYIYTLPAATTATVAVAAATLTQGARTITRSSGNWGTDGVQPGYKVYGPGVPWGAYVESLDSASQITISEAASTTGMVALKLLFPPGTYQWWERVYKGGEVYVADSGRVEVAADLNGAPAGSQQAWADRMLPLVEDIIAGRIGADTESYAIANRSKVATRMETWLKFRDYLRAQVAEARYPGRIRTARATFTGTEAEQ